MGAHDNKYIANYRFIRNVLIQNTVEIIDERTILCVEKIIACVFNHNIFIPYHLSRCIFTI